MRAKAISIFLLTTACVSSPTEQVISPQSPEMEEVQHFLSALHDRSQFNGGISISLHGEPVYRDVFGTASRENDRPLTVDNRFYIASVSKMFTAVAALILVEDGIIKLDDPVTTYIPTFPYTDMTVRHLIEHTSGLYPYNPLFKRYWSDPSKIAANQDILQIYIDHKPDPFFAAGTEWSYSNAGYVFLSMVIESSLPTSNLKSNFSSFLRFTLRQIHFLEVS